MTQTSTITAKAKGLRLLPTDFFCLTCNHWTPVAPARIEQGAFLPDATCAACGEGFQCGECGFEIDLAGDCQRPEGHLPVGTEA